MAAGLGFKTFTTGEVLTAADTNGYLMQGILVFASSAARATAITSPQEGQYSYLKDTNALEYYDGAAWVGAPVGDITAVTAGKGLTGGGSSGDVTVSLATTAKGDLVAGSGASTAAVLTVGNNGETLVADSSTSTGLRYNPQNALANPVINGGMDIWQRGTSIAAAGTGYNADRWAGYLTSGRTVTRQATGDTTNLPNIQYCSRVQRNSGNTDTTVMQYIQSIETANSIPYAGKTVTLSFYARKGANYSSASDALTALLVSGTGTDQSQVTGFTGAVTLISQTATLTTTWQRFAYTATIGATATELGIQFQYTPVGTAGAADYFEVTGVQIDYGTYTSSTAPAFRRAGGTIQGELAACQRYYEKTYAIGTAAGTNTSVGLFINYGSSESIGNTVVTIPMQVAKRNVSYSVAVYTSSGTANSWSYARSGAAADTTMTIDLKSERTFRAYGAVGANWVVATINGHWVVDNEL